MEEEKAKRRAAVLKAREEERQAHEEERIRQEREKRRDAWKQVCGLGVLERGYVLMTPASAERLAKEERRAAEKEAARAAAE